MDKGKRADLWNRVRATVRDVIDFPQPGIVFKDFTPVLADGALFREVVDYFADFCRGKKIDRVAAIDARGFIWGGALAYRLGLGFIPLRKKGKLPYKTIDRDYQLEYGTASLSMHVDAVKKGERILLVDDLIATGGTAAAAAELIEAGGGEIAAMAFLVELAALKGRSKISKYLIEVPVVY